jgi:hypothetical protein
MKHQPLAAIARAAVLFPVLAAMTRPASEDKLQVAQAHIKHVIS